MAKYTKDEAGYLEYPFDDKGTVRRVARSVYPCYRCKHWQGGKGKDAEHTVAHCDLVDEEVGWHSNCLYWSMFGLRPSISVLGKLGKSSGSFRRFNRSKKRFFFFVYIAYESILA